MKLSLPERQQDRAYAHHAFHEDAEPGDLAGHTSSPGSSGSLDNLLDLLNHSPCAQETTSDTVGESDQSQGTDHHTHEIVERK